MTLRVEGAHKRFRPRRGAEVVALDGVDLDVREGELLVVVGPSGSGKSTLLRAVAGLEALDAGRVVIDGVDVTAVPAGRRGVAMVFQEAALFPHLSVAANIGIGERARGADRAGTATRVAEVARTLGVDALLDRMPGQLSGGERQRVALARAMIRSPRVCLLDEPLAAVDAELRLRMRGEIRSVQRALGVPMLHVTHDQVEAMALGDRIAVMDGGRVLQCDTPEVVYSRPATVGVARGVGALPMNVLRPAGGVVLGVRPERLYLETVQVNAPDLPAGQRDRSGAVVSIEPTGEESLVRVRLQGDEGDVLVRVPAGAVPTVGEAVRVRWAEQDEHRFDATTGERR